MDINTRESVTRIEIYLEDHEVETLRTVGILAIPDPLTDGTIVLYDTPFEDRPEDVDTTCDASNVARRVESGSTPITWTNAHVDAEGRNSGPTIEVYGADER